MRGTRRALPALIAFAAGGLAMTAASPAKVGADTAGIGFSTPTVVDPIHTFGEPDIAIDDSGRVFASGPTGTGTQRSMWYGSVDGGRTFREVAQQPAPPNGLAGTNSPPGGGDTEIVFDHKKPEGMYFSDLYALTCFRVESSHDGGATTTENAYPGGCAGNPPTADRQWQAVFDPPAGVTSTSPYTGATPLIYLTYNGGGALWTKSTDGTTFTPADGDVTHFGNDGYPAIDQVTGKVFEAAGDGKGNLLLNIGTPDASGNLKFLDDATGGAANLITVASGILGSPNAHWPVLSIDSARNLIVSWVVSNGTTPTNDQVFVSAASAATGWQKWTAAVQVSDGVAATGDAVNVFAWVVAGGPGRADAAWYGSDKAIDPNTIGGQRWNTFMSQAVFPVDATGAVTGAAPAITAPIKASPHPMHYDDVCGAGTGCILQQGNRNLADFFKITIDATGAAEIVYNDTSNGLLQPGAPPSNQTADHAGAPVVTVVRQNSGLGLFGTPVSGVSAAPVDHLDGTAGSALYPVIGGSNVPGMNLLSSGLSLSGSNLTVTMKVADLTDLSTPSKVGGAPVLEYVTRWVMATPSDTQHPFTMFYAAMLGNASAQSFYAGPAQSSDLCSVSACFPHVVLFPESAGAAPGSPVNGAGENGTVSCPTTPSAKDPCTITITVNTADIGSPTASSLLEEVGAYALAGSHLQATTTTAQSQADNVPVEIDGICCYNYQGQPAQSVPEIPAAALVVVAAAGLIALGQRRRQSRVA